VGVGEDLVAKSNTLVSLLLQLMKATVFALCNILSFHQVLYAIVMSTDMSEVDVALFPFF
jgi:hypothetical protein